MKLTLEKDGIKVGDKVELDYEGTTYKGYVAVICPIEEDVPFLLRLDGYDGDDKYWLWQEDWFPESEKKNEPNCHWASKEDFRVIKEEERARGPFDYAYGFTPEQVNRIWTCDIEDEYIKSKLYLSFTINEAPKKAQTFMSIISNTFKSKENKALEYFNLGTTDKLTNEGRAEFVDFLFETLKEEKKAFLNKIVEAYKENKE